VPLKQPRFKPLLGCELFIIIKAFQWVCVRVCVSLRGRLRPRCVGLSRGGRGVGGKSVFFWLFF
jgi:hypothetical protein